MRTRRCSWQMGFPPCHAPATKRVKATYLDAPTDTDPLFCDAHAERVGELLRPGWAIAAIETLEQRQEVGT